MISLIDTHAHLDLPQFDADRRALLERSLAAGVHATLVIGYDPERWRATALLCAARPEIVRAAGLHPNSAKQWSSAVQAGLEAEVAGGDVVAIGEIGLDYYRGHADPALQRTAFAAQLRLAHEARLPIVIHQRQAETDILTMLEALAPLHGVLHCFSGDAAFAERCIALGLHLGIGGVATYPKSDAIRDAIAAAPIERLLLETDAPFLAPLFRRGQRNEPAFMIETLDIIANVRRVGRDEVGRVTTANALDLFGAQLKTALAAGLAYA